nr:MAG TPA: hypothetical protein [Caudoviricetes sp.]
MSLYTVYTSPKTATQAETTEQAVSITVIPYLPIFTTGVFIITQSKCLYHCLAIW